jgi:hypothetical protein
MRARPTDAIMRGQDKTWFRGYLGVDYPHFPEDGTKMGLADNFTDEEVWLVALRNNEDAQGSLRLTTWLAPKGDRGLSRIMRGNASGDRAPAAAIALSEIDPRIGCASDQRKGFLKGLIKGANYVALVAIGGERLLSAQVERGSSAEAVERKLHEEGFGVMAVLGFKEVCGLIQNMRGMVENQQASYCQKDLRKERVAPAQPKPAPPGLELVRIGADHHDAPQTKTGGDEPKRPGPSSGWTLEEQC